jgi:hypothetical protein
MLPHLVTFCSTWRILIFASGGQPLGPASALRPLRSLRLSLSDSSSQQRDSSRPLLCNLCVLCGEFLWFGWGFAALGGASFSFATLRLSGKQSELTDSDALNRSFRLAYSSQKRHSLAHPHHKEEIR